MKKIIAISILLCMLSLTACAKSPEQATESKGESAVSQPSEVTSTDAKIEVSATSQTEDVSPLTLEQVKQIIKDSEGQENRFQTIRNELRHIQKTNSYQDESGKDWRTFELSDENGLTMDKIAVNTSDGYVFYQHNDNEGHLISEEVLYNAVADMNTEGMSVERVQEILTLSETEAVKEGITQSEYVCHELQKMQEPGIITMPIDDGGLLFCDAYYLPLENINSRKIVLMKVPNSETNMGNPEIGDTILYLVEIDAHGNYLSKELLYEARYEE